MDAEISTGLYGSGMIFGGYTPGWETSGLGPISLTDIIIHPT